MCNICFEFLLSLLLPIVNFLCWCFVRIAIHDQFISYIMINHTPFSYNKVLRIKYFMETIKYNVLRVRWHRCPAQIIIPMFDDRNYRFQNKYLLRKSAQLYTPYQSACVSTTKIINSLADTTNTKNLLKALGM